MGTYITHDVVAWSADGASVLIHRTGSSSGDAGTSNHYLLVSAGDPHPLVVSFTNTRDPERATEHVGAAACSKAVDELARALAARRFRGVALRREQCKNTKREVVAVSADTAAATAMSWVASPIVRTASPREIASAQAATLAGGEPGDVSTTTGALILVSTGINGDSSGPAHVAVMHRTKSGYVRLVDDLRDVSRAPG